MLTEIELLRVKRLRAELNELVSKIVPYHAIQCSECGCQILWAHEDTGAIHCGGCGIQLAGGLILEDEIDND